MKECRWLKPVTVGQFEFVECTPDNHLRHTKFGALREDNNARTVHREKSVTIPDAPFLRELWIDRSAGLIPFGR
jgi:ATP-dependent DNA ligase